MQGVQRPGGHGRRPDIQAWRPGWLAEGEPEAPAGSTEHLRPPPQLYGCTGHPPPPTRESAERWMASDFQGGLGAAAA